MTLIRKDHLGFSSMMTGVQVSMGSETWLLVTPQQGLHLGAAIAAALQIWTRQM